MSLYVPVVVDSKQGTGSPYYLENVNSVFIYTIGGKEYAFTTSWADNALSVFDISNPSSISLAGVVAGAGSPNYLNSPRDVYVTAIGEPATEYAFVATSGSDSLEVFDVSTPSSPSHVGRISGAGSPNYLGDAYSVKVYTVGGTEYAFLTGTSDNSLVIIDVSTPSSPQLEGVIFGAGSPNYLNDAIDVFVTAIGEPATEYAFVTAWTDDSLTIIDVSTPSSPSYHARIDGGGSPNYLQRCFDVEIATINGTEYALVASNVADALSIFDVSNPGSPSIIYAFVGGGSPFYLDGAANVRIIIIEGKEYACVVADNDDALSIFDVSNLPSTPSKISDVRGTGSPNYLSDARGVDVVTIDGKTYAVTVAYVDDAISVFDITGFPGGEDTLELSDTATATGPMHVASADSLLLTDNAIATLDAVPASEDILELLDNASAEVISLVKESEDVLELTDNTTFEIVSARGSEDALELLDNALVEYTGAPGGEDVLELLDNAVLEIISALSSEDILELLDNATLDTFISALSAEDSLVLTDTALVAVELATLETEERLLLMDATAVASIISKLIAQDIFLLHDTLSISNKLAVLQSEDVLSLVDTAKINKIIVRAVSEDVLSLTDIVQLEKFILRVFSEDALSVSDNAIISKITFKPRSEDSLVLTSINPLVSVSTPLWMPSRHNFGLYINSGKVVKYTDTVSNPNAFSFVARILPQFNVSEDSNVDKYIFKFYSSNDADNYVVLYFDESDSDWVLTWASPSGTSITLRTQDVQRFLTDNFLELSGWVDADGRDIDGTTYYSKFFVNGIEVDATTTALSALASNLDTLYIGSNNGTSEYAMSEIIEIALFSKALLDDELVSIFYSRSPLLNFNAAWSVNYTLAAEDKIVYNSGTGEVELFTTAINQTARVENLASGRNATIRGARNEESTLYFPKAADEIKVIYRPHWK